MNGIIKGTILSIEDSICRVAPVDNISSVSPWISIPSHISGLAKGDRVAYTVFSDGTGLILGKM